MKTTFLDLATLKVPGQLAREVMRLMKEPENLASSGVQENVISFMKDSSFCQHFLRYFELSTDLYPKLLTAWAHKSICHEFKESFPVSYERLEFLGDSIFNFYITQKLYGRYPNKNEGELSKLKSELVSGVELSGLAELIGLDHFVILGVGELKNKSFQNKSILSDIFESTLAVVFLNEGKEKCWSFLDQCLKTYDEVNGESYFDEKRLIGADSKGKLQEFTMKEYECLPSYSARELNDGTFEVSLYINEKLYSIGRAKSKKIAEKQAAYMTLKNFNESNGELHVN